MSKLKKKFNENQIQDMLSMRDKNWSVGQIARYFETNKPSILKALHIWDTGDQFLPDGRAFLIHRGKVTMMPHKDKGAKKETKKQKKERELNEALVKTKDILDNLPANEEAIKAAVDRGDLDHLKPLLEKA